MSIIMRLLELEKKLGAKHDRIEDNFIEALLDSPELDMSAEEKARYLESRDWLGLLNAMAVEDWSDYEHTKTD